MPNREYFYVNKGRMVMKEKPKEFTTKEIDRTKVLFPLIPSRMNKNILIASDRSYHLSEDGSLRRMNSKETKAERKARKREMRKRND